MSVSKLNFGIFYITGLRVIPLYNKILDRSIVGNGQVLFYLFSAGPIYVTI